MPLAEGVTPAPSAPRLLREGPNILSKQTTMVYRRLPDSISDGNIVEVEGAKLEYQVLDLDDGECPDGWARTALDALTAPDKDTAKGKKKAKKPDADVEAAAEPSSDPVSDGDGH